MVRVAGVGRRTGGDSDVAFGVVERRDGQVVGVLGGHEGGGATADVSYSVVFRAEAAALYREAAGCGPSQVGSS